jgi:hypothetical protein
LIAEGLFDSFPEKLFSGAASGPATGGIAGSEIGWVNGAA